LDPGEPTRQVALLTPTPYAVGQVYTAAITMSSGVYTWSFLVGDAPTAPGITAAPSGPGQITVSWLPADGHGLPISTYQVTNVTTGAVQQVGGDRSAATFGGLVPGTMYEFEVRAANDLGASPPTDTFATALAVPAEPTIVTALPGSASAFLSWSFVSTAVAPIDSFQMDLDGGVPFDVGTAADHTLAGLLQGHQYSVRVRGVNAAGPGSWSAPATVTPRAPGLLFHGLPLPQRVLDTRATGGPIAAGAVRAVQVVAITGAATEAVAAISLNLTAADPTGPGYLTAWPCDGSAPTTSSVNYDGGEHGVPNHVIVPVSADGTVCILAGVNATDVVVDVDGWFSRASGLTPERPHRALDTRTTTGPTTDVAVLVAPPGARAAIVNITAAGGSATAGYVTAYPCGASLPLVSNVNFGRGQTVANSAVAPVASDGSLCLHAYAATNLVVDVAGYITDNFVTVGPTRILDTRSSSGPTTDATLTAVPAGAMGAVLNATAAGGSAGPGFVTIHPADGPRPPTSNLNFGPGQVVPNAAVVRPDASGRVHLAASTPVELVVDVFGYFR
jgi:Fibronectin type III domain